MVIKLGTNDSKPFNWKYKAGLPRDIQTMVDAFPSVDKALLEKWFHVVYYDVTHCYGNPRAVSGGTDFYRYMKDAMLATELEEGSHKLVLRLSKEKNPASLGTECQIRNFVVNR